MKSLIPTTRNGQSTPRHFGFGTFPTLSTWLDDMLNDTMPTFQGDSMPSVNIKETDDAFTLELAVPGMNKSDFNIDLDNDTLTVASEIKHENNNENDGYTRREFRYASFKRTFTLPETVDGDKIKAVYKDGILAIDLPKREEAKAKPVRTIKIS